MVWQIASQINLDTDGLNAMVVFSVLCFITEPIIVFSLFKANQRPEGCAAIAVALLTIVQIVNLISFAAFYAGTDADYQKLLANSA